MAASTIIGGIEKTIKYDRLTKDYSCFISIDGGTEEYIGSASTYGQAETKCNEYAYDYFNDTCTPEAAAQLLDTRTPQEIAYDALKDGSVYVAPVADEPKDASATPRLTFAEYAATNPESRAIYDTMSPEARRVADKLIGILDRMPDSEVDQAIDQTLLVFDTLAKLPADSQAERERQRALGFVAGQKAAAELYTAPATVQADDEADDENPLTPEEEAAYDAANQQKVYDRIKSAFANKSDAPMFVDTLPGRINDTPIDLLVAMNIGANMERNLGKLGITRDQLFRILEVAVNPVIDEYLITPARRMRLIWDGME